MYTHKHRLTASSSFTACRCALKLSRKVKSHNKLSYGHVVTSSTPFTNRQHSLGVGPTLTQWLRYSSCLPLFVFLYCLACKFAMRSQTAAVSAAASLSDLVLLEFNRLTLQFWKNEKGNEKKNLFIPKEKEDKTFGGPPLQRSPCQPLPAQSF